MSSNALNESFSIYPLMWLMVSPLTAFLLRTFKPRDFIRLGTLIYGKTVARGPSKGSRTLPSPSPRSSRTGTLTVFYHKRTAFFWTLFCLRAFEGVAACVVQVTAYSIGCVMFPSEITTVVAILETSAGVGLAVGPAVGSLLFTTLGFKGSTGCALRFSLQAPSWLWVPAWR